MRSRAGIREAATERPPPALTRRGERSPRPLIGASWAAIRATALRAIGMPTRTPTASGPRGSTRPARRRLGRTARRARPRAAAGHVAGQLQPSSGMPCCPDAHRLTIAPATACGLLLATDGLGFRTRSRLETVVPLRSPCCQTTPADSLGRPWGEPPRSRSTSPLSRGLATSASRPPEPRAHVETRARSVRRAGVCGRRLVTHVGVVIEPVRTSGVQQWPKVLGCVWGRRSLPCRGSSVESPTEPRGRPELLESAQVSCHLRAISREQSAVPAVTRGQRGSPADRHVRPAQRPFPAL